MSLSKLAYSRLSQYIYVYLLDSSVRCCAALSSEVKSLELGGKHVKYWGYKRKGRERENILVQYVNKEVK